MVSSCEGMQIKTQSNFLVTVFSIGNVSVFEINLPANASVPTWVSNREKQKILQGNYDLVARQQSLRPKKEAGNAPNATTTAYATNLKGIWRKQKVTEEKKTKCN